MNASSIFNIKKKKPLTILMSYLPKHRKLEIIQRNKHLQKLLKIKEVLYEIYSLKNSKASVTYSLKELEEDDFTKREILNSLFDISNLPFLNGIGFTLEGHTNKIANIVKLPPIEEGEYKIASYGWDNTIKIWDIDTKELVLTLPSVPNNDIICTLIPFYDEHDVKHQNQRRPLLILALTWDKYIIIYDLKKAYEEKERRIRMEEDQKLNEKINLDTSTSLNQKKNAKENENPIITKKNPPEIYAIKSIEQIGKLLCAIRNDKYLITATYYKEIRVWKIPDFYEDEDVFERVLRSSWDPKNFVLHTTLMGHTDVVPKVINLKDGRVASCSWDQTIKIWDFKKSKSDITKCDISIETDYKFINLFLLKDDRIAAMTGDDVVRIYNIETKQCEFLFEGTDFIYQLKDGRVVTGIFDLKFQIFNLDTQKPELIYKTSHKDTISCFLQLDDGRIMTGSYDKSIKLYGFVTNKELNNEALDYDFKYENDCLNIIYKGPVDYNELYKNSKLLNKGYYKGTNVTKTNLKNKKGK